MPKEKKFMEFTVPSGAKAGTNLDIDTPIGMMK